MIDQDHLLVCKTLDLPVPFYFLPGGHIEHGESAEAAVMRELMEEGGAACRIKRFLGCLEHSFEPGRNSICHNHEYNFYFEAESDVLKYDLPLKQCEDHIQLMWVSVSDLNAIDFRPAPLMNILPEWLEQEPTTLFKSSMV